MDDGDGGEHIQVSDELAQYGTGQFGDALELASKPDKKKVTEGGRAAAEGLAWASCGMRGWRESMEDASLMMPAGYIGGNWRDAALFGVFDGHCGEQVARFAVRQLPMVLGQLKTQDPELALTQAFLRIDETLRLPATAAELRELTIPGNMVRDSAENCGCTAVCCMVLGSKLVLAHAGDSRAVLCQKGKAINLTEDHKPEVPSETARIEAAGGYVEEEVAAFGIQGYRVNGNLNLSRALGDLRYKDASMAPEKQIICGVPDTKTVTWQAGHDEFVLIGCDGLWECMSSQQAINFVRTRLPPPGSKRGMGPVLEALLDEVCAAHPTQRGGLGCDNITAVLIRFEDPADVTAAGEEEDHQEEEEEAVSGAETRRREAAAFAFVQRLADRRWAKKETKEEKAEREKQEKEEREEQEARAKERREQEEVRKKRKVERELLESKSKKKLKCCAAVESDDDDDEDGFVGFED